MKRIRCQLIPGDGVTVPLRAPWPTYTMVAVDQAAGRCVVLVPDADIPDADRDHVLIRGLPAIDLPDRARVPALEARIAAHLDARYPEHAGRWRPEPR